MVSRIGVPVLALVCLASLSAQEEAPPLLDLSRAELPADEPAERRVYQPKRVPITADMRIKDDPIARRESMKERMGGPLTSEFREGILAEIAAVERAYPNVYKPGAVAPGAPGTWTNIGPVRSNWIQNGGERLTKSDTGRVRTIAVDPDNPDIVYLLTSGGGLWKTSDFLSARPTWEPKSDAVSAAGGAIALGPLTSTGRTVFLGTGDPFDFGRGGFVVKSVDGGNTWSTPPPDQLGGATVVTDIKVDGDRVFVGTNAGLWRSDNRGATFVAAGPTSTPFNTSSRNNRLFTAWSIVKTSGAWLVSYQVAPSLGSAPVFGAIYRSTEGVFWAPVIPFTGNAAAAIGRATLAVAEPGDPVAYAFAATLADAGQKDLYRITTSGTTTTFSRLRLDEKTPVNANQDQPDMDVMRDQPFYNQMLLVDPTDTDRNTLYIGGQLSSAKTTDGGQTWRLVSHWMGQHGLSYVHADFHAAAYVPQTNTVLVGTEGGLFVSADGGATWSDRKNDGIASYLVYALASNEKHHDDVLVGLQDNGTRLRVGRGNTYNQVFGGDGFGVGWGEDAVLGSSVHSFIFRTPLGTPAAEQKWRVGWTGIAEEEFFKKNPETGELEWPNAEMTHFNTAIYQPSRLAARDGSTFYHRTRYTLYRTTDSAGSWAAVGNFKLTPGPNALQFAGTSHPIGVGHTNQEEIAVAMSNARVMISTDGGTTVRVVLPSPLSPVAFRNFPTAAVAWANRDELYLSTENPDRNAPHLIRSKDAGQTWQRLDGSIAGGLPAVPISKILVHPRVPNTVFVGTWIGVFVSENAGATWAPLGQGFPLGLVNDLYMPADGSFLRAASYGRGVWDYRF